jgi:hypothetical protein
MVTKEQLLKDLRSDLSFEEELIDKLTNFYAVMKIEEAAGKGTAERVNKDIGVLRTESEKHALYIKEMISYIESSEKNGF